MADTTFVDKVTHVVATWLNDVNKAVYRAIGTGAGGVAPQTPADVRHNLGLDATVAPSGASLIGNAPAGTIASNNVQDALNELDTEKAPSASPTFTGFITINGTTQANGLIEAFDGTGVPTLTSGVVPKSIWVGYQAPVGGAGTNIPSALHSSVGTALTTNEFGIWSELLVFHNLANTGEHVGKYSQAWKDGVSSTWAGVFESHDSTHIAPTASLYGVEIDVSANGTDLTGGFHRRFGLQIVGFRDDPVGAQNIVGHGIDITAADSDPTGTYFTNFINIKSQGSIGINMTQATLDVGTQYNGAYNTCCMQAITVSGVPVISTIGSAASHFWALASTDAMWNGAAIGAYAGKMAIKVDGVTKYVPVYA